MDGAPDDQLEPVTRQRRRLVAMLEELSDEEWAADSRCDGWSVHDVAAHLVGVNRFWCASVAAGLAGAPTRVLTGFDPKATPELMVAQMRGQAPGETLAQLRASNEALLDLFATASATEGGWALAAEAPPGHISIRVLAHHALWDSWVHERDIALPLGRTVPVEPDETLSSLRYVGALSLALAITMGRPVRGFFAVEATDPSSVFVVETVGEEPATSVVVRYEAPPGDVACLRGDAAGLVDALSLRGPLPQATPADWVGLLAGLTSAFDGELDTSTP